MSNFLEYNQAVTLVTKIDQRIDALGGAFILKGSVAFANLPAAGAMTADTVGSVYNVTDDFTTDSRFVEGAGQVYPAGTNVAIVDIGSAGTPDIKYDVLAGFIDVDAIEGRIDDTQAMIAPEFDAATAYNAGDVVTYNDDLYKFTADHAAGAWTGSDVSAVTVIGYVDASDAAIAGTVTAVDQRVDAAFAVIADEFDATASYNQGDVVVYEDVLYQFTSAHAAGAWTGSDATSIDVISYVDAADAALDTNINAVDGRVDDVVSTLADEFDATVAYTAGDVVVYEDKVYKFDVDHTAGAWIGSDATAVTLESLIDSAEPDELTTAQMTALLAILD